MGTPTGTGALRRKSAREVLLAIRVDNLHAAEPLLIPRRIVVLSFVPSSLPELAWEQKTALQWYGATRMIGV